MKKNWEQIFVAGVLLLVAFEVYRQLTTTTIPSVAQPQSPGTQNLVANLVAFSKNLFGPPSTTQSQAPNQANFS